MNVTIRVNGQPHTVDVDPATPLLYILSDDLALRGPKFGCGLGQCGCCTVIVRKAALSGPQAVVRSCVTPVSTMNGAPIQKAFIDEQAMQCGFCLSGVMLTAKVALDRNPRATDAQLRQALSNVLCRCGAHTRMMKAIRKYQQEVRA